MLLRAVVDTNVVVSGIISPHGSARQILLAWQQQQYLLLTSPAIISEVVRVLQYPHLQNKYQLSESNIQAITTSLLYDTHLLQDTYQVQHRRDPDDDMFLACALEGQADYLVSGDNHLIEIKYYHSTQIVTPYQFIRILPK